ncbi:hypothetical protein JL107_02655 [Nakamurella flavida]|uniref:Uncharacterized protein n=1 Tax=Nakamurella flavida TaxID=363630 RepID=A0A938YIG2_9ACTN|nr:hypothetical protein [Nakamurella flavida]MBM9475338.1 hypothetical protein [Nakamurella flavida]MDP9776915.1 hypothetical protein [Nakamurella flavida]
MPDQPRQPLSDLPASRLLGHPVVLVVISLAFVATVWTLISMITDGESSPGKIIFRSLSVVVVGFATWSAWQLFQARRRARNS